MDSSIRAVSKTEFQEQRWSWPNDFRFAAGDTLAPLSAQELSKAAVHFPIGFIKAEAGFIPVAVMGLRAGSNLLLGPDFRWKTGYIPAIYRGHPFSLARTAEGQSILMVEMASGLVSESGAEAFFEADGKPTQVVQKVLEFLQQLQSGRDLTALICKSIAELDLFEPWPISVIEEGVERQLSGLYRVNEHLFKQLPIESLDALRRSDALTLIYCHLLSMQHIHTLGEIATKEQETMTILGRTKGELDLEFLNGSGTLGFDGVR